MEREGLTGQEEKRKERPRFDRLAAGERRDEWACACGAAAGDWRTGKQAVTVGIVVSARNYCTAGTGGRFSHFKRIPFTSPLPAVQRGCLILLYRVLHGNVL